VATAMTNAGEDAITDAVTAVIAGRHTSIHSREETS
jgi:hypothetical protein